MQDNFYQLRAIVNDLHDSTRFFKLETEVKFWFYDSYSHSLYSIRKDLFEQLEKSKSIQDLLSNYTIEDCTKVLNFLLTIKKNSTDSIPEYSSSAKCTVMINTSNRCNLNCTYCYRDKTNPNIITINTVEKIIDFIQNKYKPSADEYVISYSMTSESSVDLPLLKQIADKYVDFENYKFNEQDIPDSIFYAFYERLKIDLFNKLEKRIAIPEQNKIAVIDFLNQLLDFRDLFDILQLTDSMFDEAKLSEIKKRHILGKWRVFRINRWCLELYYDKYLQKRNVPYVCFWFMTNGTCASDEFIQFIKSCDINPLWISIDGIQNIHDSNRSFADLSPSYNKIVNNIKKFKQNNLKLRASVVLTSDYPYPLRIIKHLTSLGFESFSITPVRPGAKNSFNNDNTTELFLGYDEVFEEIKKQLLRKDYSLLQMLHEDMMLAPFYFFINRTKEIKRCSFDDQLVINSKGEIYPCLYFTNNIHFSSGTIYENFDCEKNKLNMNINKRGKCHDCWARYLCGGTCLYASYVSTGNPLDIDPIECRIKKYLAEKCLQLLVFIKEHNISL